MDTIELKDGTLIKCKALTMKKYQELLNDSVAPALEPFKTRYDLEVHQLKNGNVVVNENDHYTLYYQLDDLTKVLVNAFESEAESHELLRNKNPYGDRFPDHTATLITELLVELGIDSSQLDQAIKDVDEKLSKRKDRKMYKKTHLMHFIALIGEAINKELNGKWSMKQGEDGDTWNPYLIVRNQEIQFVTQLYDEIFLYDSENHALLQDVYGTTKGIIQYNLR